MDNRIFNVNGEGDEMLLHALELVFAQEGENTKAAAWKYDQKKGLILLWYADERAVNFPAPLTPKACLPFILAWLETKDAAAVERTHKDASIDHDGSNGAGWRVYCEDWGHVGDFTNAICAIKPVTLWFGK